jgi:hypothetical protein
MTGRYRSGRRRHPPAHLRIVIPVVQPVDPEAVPPALPDGYLAEVLNGVVQNLLRDARYVTNASMNAVVDEFAGHGLEPSPEQVAAIRKGVFDVVVGAFRARLLSGLSDECGPPADDTSEPPMGAVHLIEGLPPGGDLLRRFRETLMSEEGEHP